MNKEILFEETQRFSQPFIWIIILVLDALFVWGVVQQIVLGIPWGNQPASDIGLLFFALIPICLTLLFYFSNLQTQVTREEIQIKFPPFFSSFKTFKWSDLKKAEVIEYKPIWAYGGWGIRMVRDGIAYNVGGKRGIRLVPKDSDRHVLIGTQKPEELKEVLKSIRVGKNQR